MPIVYDDQIPGTYSTLTAAIYEGCFRGLWGMCLGGLIILCETGRGGWISEILSSNMWLVPSRLNLSAYFVHYMIQFALVKYIFVEQYYLSTAIILAVCFVTSCLMFIGGFVFYVLFEAPFAYMAEVLLRRIQGRFLK